MFVEVPENDCSFSHMLIYELFSHSNTQTMHDSKIFLKIKPDIVRKKIVFNEAINSQQIWSQLLYKLKKSSRVNVTNNYCYCLKKVMN